MKSEQWQSLAGEWELVVSDAGAYSNPGDIPAQVRRIPAPVPGTVAEALHKSGKFDPDRPIPLNDRDFWYLARLAETPPGRVRLIFEGLATIAEVFVNGRHLLSSRSQFVKHEIDAVLRGDDEIAICFRALNPHLKGSGPRARWKTKMFSEPGLRFARTTLLGHMPGWCPSIEAIGPFRPVYLARGAEDDISGLTIRSGLDDDGRGKLDISFLHAGRPGDLRIACAGQVSPVMISPDGRLTASLVIEGVDPWWPHTHGQPALYDIFLMRDGEPRRIGRTGFRKIEADNGPEGCGFGLIVNGQPVFCRGAVWTNADILRLPGGRADYLPWLTRARDAGMNMIRIGGTMTYETREFYDLCDELGLLVWQDFMFANFDYPASDEEFTALISAEAEGLLEDLQGSPSLAVLCGGSEMYQQAAMLGLPRKYWANGIVDTLLASCSARNRPDAIYIPNTPFGGAMPFSPNQGVTHYYGVGAYCRPLEDARRAEVRFSAESLAFANVPEQQTLDAFLTVPPVHHPLWKARVPRDNDASWDFEDIRDHYLQTLYDCDAIKLRREDVSRYLDFSRATSAEVMEATFSEWRRPGSTCRGAIAWTLQDLAIGAGWGVIDATGLEKAAWHGLRRAMRPLQLILSDEGTNGLYVHIINEGGEPFRGQLSVSALRDGQTPVAQGATEIGLDARSHATLAATDLFGAFFDTTYAFRFGPPAHDVTVATLIDHEGKDCATAFHFPRGRSRALHPASLSAVLYPEADNWILKVSSDRLVQSINLSFEGWRPSDNWFHLEPGRERSILLSPLRPGTADRPAGTIGHLGTASRVAL